MYRENSELMVQRGGLVPELIAYVKRVKAAAVE
jgi:hypothetical protein